MARRRFKPDGHDADLTAEPAKADEGVFVGPPAPHPAPELDLDAPAPAAPVAMPMPDAGTLLLPLEERLRRVEAALTRLAELQEPGDPGAGQVTARPGAPSVLSRAAALLPALHLDRPAGAATAGTAGRPGLLRDSLAELQAIYYMYVDPRYRLSRFGRFTPLVLLLMFLTSSWWLPVPLVLAVFFDPLAKLAISYALFKVLALEARRYRETAPDLPAHLRL